MPPKKGNQPNKKKVEKAKVKAVEDKTFGLKNKKGKKTQQMVQTMHQSVKGADQLKRQKEKEEELKRKEQMEKDKMLVSALFKPVDQKITKGADPKSILCQFFKKGLCTKGNKCKFSHDVAVERKAAKRNVYEQEEEEEDKMESWDQEKLQSVVDKKHGGEGERVKTTIVCKHFLDALENNKYGWFWECPNGGEKCQYKHALPKGYILKKDKKRMEEEEEKITLEDLIEKERAALDQSKVTRVTAESFAAWKKKKIAEKRRKLKEETAKKKKSFRDGKGGGSTITGREMFSFNPDFVQNDDAEADDTKYEREDQEEEASEKEQRADGEDDAEQSEEGETKEKEAAKPAVVFDASIFAAEDDFDDLDDEEDDETENTTAAAAAAAAAGSSNNKNNTSSAAAAAAAVPLDEDLFGDADLGDLDLEDEDDE